MISMDGKKYCYEKIKEYILSNIKLGKYTDYKIESENQLCQKFSTSRMTVRQALASLQDEGYIYTIPKKGSFVSLKKPVKQLDGLRSFTEDMDCISKTYSHVTLLEYIQNPTVHISSTYVWHVGRIRFYNEKAIAYEEGYFDGDLIPHLDKDVLEHSLYEYIENTLNKQLYFAKQEISAVYNQDICSKLNITTQEPLLKVNQITYLKDNQCIEVCDTYYSCKDYKFKQNAYRR